MKIHRTSFALLIVALVASGCATDEAEMSVTPRGDAGRADSGARPDATSVARELCNNGLDDDSNGRVDDGCTCMPGTMQSCFQGAPPLAGRGVCARGTQRCEGNGEFGVWGGCQGSGSPTAELCDGLDNDCDGTVDTPACHCRANESRVCYTGPAGTQDQGICHGGMQTCVGESMTDFGPCVGEVLPAMEVCMDHIDNDCDGMVDEDCPLCPPGQEPIFDLDDTAYGQMISIFAADSSRYHVRCGPPRCPPGQAQITGGMGDAFLGCSPIPPCRMGETLDVVQNAMGTALRCQRCAFVIEYSKCTPHHQRHCAPPVDVMCGGGEIPRFDLEGRRWLCAPVANCGTVVDIDGMIIPGGAHVCIPCDGGGGGGGEGGG